MKNTREKIPTVEITEVWDKFNSEIRQYLPNGELIRRYKVNFLGRIDSLEEKDNE